MRWIIASLLLVVGLVAGTTARADDAALQAAARHEGSVTWYITHYSGELAQEAARHFTAKHPGVRVNVVRTTAQIAYARLTQDIKAGVANCDVFSSTDISHYIELKTKGLLARFTPEDAGRLSPEFLKFSDPGLYYPTSAGMVLIAYNTKLVPPGQAPRNWTDFLDPKWRGKISLGHPGFSGYVGTWVIAMRNLYGWDFFKKLEKNKPLIGRSINDTVTMLNSGEREIAAGPDQTTVESAAHGNPLAIVYPTDGAVLMVSPSAIMKNAPHPNAARLFMDYLMSADYSRVLVANLALPMRPDVAPPKGMRPLSEIKLIRPTDAEIVSDMPKVIESWRDLFGG